WAGHRPWPALWRAAAVSPRRASPAGPSGSTRPRRHSPPPSRGDEPPSRSGGRASFFERILRVRAGDPGLGPPPANPQPLERVPDGLITDPLGRDPVLGADRGGQGQRPGRAGLAEQARALVQKRLQLLAALSIEELGGGVWAARLHGHHRQPAGLEGPQDVAHRLRTAPDGLS